MLSVLAVVDSKPLLRSAKALLATQAVEAETFVRRATQASGLLVLRQSPMQTPLYSWSENP